MSKPIPGWYIWNSFVLHFAKPAVVTRTLWRLPNNTDTITTGTSKNIFYRAALTLAQYFLSFAICFISARLITPSIVGLRRYRCISTSGRISLVGVIIYLSQQLDGFQWYSPRRYIGPFTYGAISGYYFLNIRIPHIAAGIDHRC